MTTAPHNHDLARPRALSDFDVATLGAALREHGFLPLHARRILRAFYDGNGSVDLDALTVGHELKRWLDENIAVRQSRVLRRCASADGTVKLLIGFDGSGAAETVVMPSHRPDRAAACVSSQIGCAMGCDFCASTKSGLERDLTAGEIVEQFLHAAAEADTAGRGFR